MADTVGPADFQTIRGTLLGITQDNTIIVAMLVGAGLESGWNMSAPGGGAWQIIDAARPKAPFSAAAQNLVDAEYMLPRYQQAAAAHANDTENADKYANIAHDAERPLLPYQASQGEARVQQVYTTVLQNYGAANATATAPVVSTNPVTNVLSGAGGVLSSTTTTQIGRAHV